jgi:DNA excision repair protein ERCC-2
LRVAELFDEQYPVRHQQARPGSQAATSRNCACVTWCRPQFIGPRLTAARSTVLFSATLSPRNYYADLLGTAGKHGVHRR